jgi:Bacterial membrane protein YfhO
MGLPAPGGVVTERARTVGQRVGDDRAWLRRHPGAAAALIYAVLAVVLFAAALIPGHTLSASDHLWTAAPWSAERPADVRPFGANYELVDSAVQFQPWLEYTRERLPDAPLWNPHVAAGRPFLGNSQSAVLSPFSLPAYLLPFWWSLGLIAVLKVFVASFGTYLLGRALRMRFGGALLAGLVFGFSLYFLSWIAWPLASVWALLPWLLLLTERVLRKPGPLPGAGLAAVVALQFFGGHPESSFHVLAVTLVFFVFRAFVLHRQGVRFGLWPPVLAFSAALAGGTALAAVILLPFLELLARSSDPDVREAFSQLALERKYVLGLVLYEYWGRATHTAVGAFAQERALYAGALPLTLAAAAVVVRPSLERVGVAAFGALMLAIVIGLPPLPDIAGQIPIVKTGNHLRLVIILVLCLALLSGWGLDDLSARRVRRRDAVLAIGLGLLALPVLVVIARGHLSLAGLGRGLEIAWGFLWPEPPANSDTRAAIRMGALIVWLTFMGLALLLLTARLRRRLAATAFVALALALTAADLFKAGMGATPAITTEEATQPSTPGLEYLESRRPNRFVGLARELGPSPLIPNTAIRWGLYDARSYDQPSEERYDALWRRAVYNAAPTENPTAVARLTPSALPAFRLLSVTDIAQDPGDPRAEDPALRLAYDGRDLRVYANPRALPRAGVVDAQRTVPDEGAQLDAVLDPSFDGRRVVVTRSVLPGLSAEPGRGPAGHARIVRYEPERVVIDATARRPSELVLTDLYYPGWRVTLDGREADLHRVNYLLRGTTLPPGRHRVEFAYEPEVWRAGWILSLVALAGLVGTVAIGLRRSR